MSDIAARGMPKICVPLTGPGLDEVLREIEYAREADADMVEWRFDLFGADATQAPFEQVARAAKPLPLILTARSRAEGGSGCTWCAGGDAVGAAQLMAAAVKRCKPAYMDVELAWDEAARAAILAAAAQAGSGVIVSRHYFTHTPTVAQMLADLRAMAALAAAHPGIQIIPKLAVMPGDYGDVLNLMQATHTFRQEFSGAVITMAMGGLGAVTRLAGEGFGSCLTFAAGLGSSAPGQLPVKQLREAMALLHDA